MATSKQQSGIRCMVCGSKVKEAGLEANRVMEPLTQQYRAADPERRARAANALVSR